MSIERIQRGVSPPVEGLETPFRVLIVDDSRLQRRILTSILQKWGYAVEEADDAQVALRLCAERLPDMIISDWLMPGTSGIEFCRQFRELSGEDFRYFILLTSKSEKSEIAQGLDAGADDFLIKPVDTSELRARITAGERIVRMQRDLTEKNQMVTKTLEELQRVYDLLDRDLMDAKKLQESLVREKYRELPEGTLSLMLQSAGHVGGDLVGYFPTDDGKLGLFAVDVSGHGVSSALMTARLMGNLSAAAPDQNMALSRQPNGRFFARPPSDVVRDLNAQALNGELTEHYFTLVLAFVDLASGLVSITQAGHPHPLVQRAGGLVERVGDGGFPVGLIEGMTYDQFEVQLQPGDRFLVLSDGVTECPDPLGEMLGEDRLETMLKGLKDVTGTALFDALIWDLALFAGTEDFPDDVSGLLFEYRGADHAR